jgi:hypothetical protein
VRQAFTRYATGGVSLRALQAEMTRCGLTNNGGKPLSLHGIETLLRNPFYYGRIEIQRTGMIYNGIHEPLIDIRTFKRVQDIRSGRAGKKTTRHDHLYRGLFRCALCNRPMTPERQKGHVYYRCQEPDCATKTIRQEVLDQAIRSKLVALSFSQSDEKKLRERFQKWLGKKEYHANITSLELRIAKIDERLDRLTDLLIDGQFDKQLFEEKKRQLSAERLSLQDELTEARKNELLPDKLEKFIELMKTLTKLHDLLVDDEKRSLVQNVFSNRTVSGKYVELEPYDWLADREFADLSPLVTHVDTLIELAPQNDNDKQPRQTSQWKRNLKNQRPDEFLEAA